MANIPSAGGKRKFSNLEPPITSDSKRSKNHIMFVGQHRPSSEPPADEKYDNTLIFDAWLHPISVMDKLIKAGADVNKKNLRGETILHLFPGQGNRALQHVNRAIEACANINARDNLQNTPLHSLLKAESPSLDMVRLLIKWGAKYTLEKKAYINLEDSDGKTALHLAVETGNKDITGLILENKVVDINLGDRDERTALHLAIGTTDTDIISLLLRNKADINLGDRDGQTALHLAVGTGWTDVISLLLENKADINLRDRDGETALHLAVRAGCTDVISLLLENKADINLGDKDGETALHLAVRAGCTDVISLLLENKADINLGDGDRETALHLAVRAGCTDVISLLLRNKADVNLRDRNEKTALQWARGKGFDVFSLLVAEGAEVNVEDRQGDTPLHHAEAKVTKLLIESGAVVDARNRQGSTALHFAGEMAAEVLIANKAELNVKNTEGKTPLHYAVKISNVEKAQSLVRLYVKHGAELNVKDTEGKTPLHYAVEISNAEQAVRLVRLLIELGAELNVSDDEGKTPLHYAAARPVNSLVLLLLKYGPELNAQDTEGKSPLHYAAATAAYIGSDSTYNTNLSLLITNGAKLDVKDESGKNPLHYAAANCAINTCSIIGINFSYLRSYFNTLRRQDTTSNTILQLPKPICSLINECDSEGATALMYAIKAELPIVAYALILGGANVNITDKAGVTPLIAAVKPSEKNINTDETDEYEIKRSENLRGSIVSMLIQFGADRKIRDGSAKTVFHLAVKTGLVKYIPVSASENIDAVDADGKTALHYSILDSYSMENLIERGADVTIQDKEGKTVIHLLSELGGYYCNELETILRHNPNMNLNLQDRDGKTALDISKDKYIKKILIQAGATFSDGRIPTPPRQIGSFFDELMFGSY